MACGAPLLSEEREPFLKLRTPGISGDEFSIAIDDEGGCYGIDPPSNGEFAVPAVSLIELRPRDEISITE